MYIIKSPMKSYKLIFLFCLMTLYSFGQLDSTVIDNYVLQVRSILIYPDSARKVSNELLKYSESNQYQWGIGKAYIFIGATFHRQSSYDSSNYYFEKALEINKTLKDSMQIATVNLNQGMIHVNKGEFELATEKILNALKIFELLADHDSGAIVSIPRCYNNLGQVYYYQGDYLEALKYFKLFNLESIKLKDTLQIASSYTNMGASYYEIGETEMTLECDKKALALHTAINNLLGMANAINNIAAGLEEKERFIEALQYYDQAIEVYQKVPNRRGMAEATYNKGRSYLALRDFDKSTKTLQTSLELAKEVKDKHLKKKIYSSLADLASQSQDYKSALAYYRQYHELNDSLINESNVSKVNELNIQYDTEKKQQQIDLLNKENLLQAAVIQRNQAFLAFLALLVLVLVGLGILIYKRSQYLNQLKLEKEKARLKTEQTNAVINSQEEERKRFAMDLHDNFGQLISALRLITNQSTELRDRSDEILDSMYDSLKEIAFNLMPKTLLDKGLIPALDELVSQLNQTRKIRFVLNQFDQGMELDQTAQIATYRIVQEIANNIIKYANATQVNISLTSLEDYVSIIIEDNGDGFDTKLLTESKGNGWRNIYSRLDLLKGDVEIDSALGRMGSTFLLNIPFSTIRKIAA